MPGLRLRSCPCCDWTGLSFRSFAVAEYVRHGALCPRCGSFERHRALAYFYSRFIPELGKRPSRIIHFAAEDCLESAIRPYCDSYDKSFYGDQRPSALRLDLTDLALPDESCDLLLLNHVLDCMRDDLTAVMEMYRVLRRGGAALATVTFREGSETRELLVASNGLHRMYGSEDVRERFRPFEVSVVNAAEGLDAMRRRKEGIPASIPLLVLRKLATEGRIK